MSCPIGIRLLAPLLMMLIAASSSSHAQTTFDEAQRRAIGEIVRDYLLKNPEVLQEAIGELERRNQEAQKIAQASALKEVKDTLLHSPRNVVIGNPKGDVTLVEFFDFNCEYCKRAVADVKALIAADPKLRVVLRDFPVLGPASVEAAQVALAAKPQLVGEKLLDYHVRVLALRGPINGERAKAVAKDMGLDMARLERDMAAPEIRDVLQENAMLGEKLGLSGTPAFIIGDEIVVGAVGLEPLRRVVAGVRQCGKATC